MSSNQRKDKAVVDACDFTTGATVVLERSKGYLRGVNILQGLVLVLSLVFLQVKMNLEADGLAQDVASVCLGALVGIVGLCVLGIRQRAYFLFVEGRILRGKGLVTYGLGFDEAIPTEKLRELRIREWEHGRWKNPDYYLSKEPNLERRFAECLFESTFHSESIYSKGWKVAALLVAAFLIVICLLMQRLYPVVNESGMVSFASALVFVVDLGLGTLILRDALGWLKAAKNCRLVKEAVERVLIGDKFEVETVHELFVEYLVCALVAPPHSTAIYILGNKDLSKEFERLLEQIRKEHVSNASP